MNVIYPHKFERVLIIYDRRFSNVTRKINNYLQKHKLSVN